MDTQVKIPLDMELIRTIDFLPDSDEILITSYDNHVPEFAGPEIDRLYEHLYCSLSYFRKSRELAGASTYVAQKGGRPVAILVYRRAGNEVTVLNDYVNLSEEEIQRFTRYIFRRFSSVKRISFGSVRTQLHSLTFPWHAMAFEEDMVVDLPPTVKGYEAAIGKNMRRNIRRYADAIAKRFPSYHYQFYTGHEIGEQHVRDIIALSCTRLQSKNIAPRFNEEETQWIADHAKECGIAGVATIDGRVCAGAIGFRMGDKYFMHVIAHDLKYNEFSLGILCYYRTICEGIERGAKRFHLLQGRYGYKYRLLAQKQDVYHVDIYRNRTQCLSYGKSLLKKEIKGRIRLAKQWLLHDVERNDNVACRLIAKAVNTARRAKRSGGFAN